MQKCQAQPTLIRVAAAASASPASAFAGAAGGICSPYCRTIAAAGLSRIPTSPRSSTKAHSAAIRRTTSRRSLTENFPLALKNVPTSLPQQFLDEACPCGNARPLKVCCYSPLDGEIRPPFPSLRPAAPVTGYGHPKCYMALTKDCCTKITGEHYIGSGGRRPKPPNGRLIREEKNGSPYC